MEMTSTLDMKEFATQNKLCLRKDVCGDSIVPGKSSAKHAPHKPQYASHVYDAFTDGRLGVCLMFTTSRKWGSVQRALEAVGCELRQNGDMEGCFKFDPANATQARAVIKLAGLKRTRKGLPATQAQLAVLEAARELKRAA